MFILSDWIIFGVIAVVMLGILILAITDSVDMMPNVIVFLVEVIIMALIMFGCGMYRTHTESGKRGVKTWQSETTGGIDRTVTVYDIQGEEVAKYNGRFDIEESSQEGVVKIKFDCDGKRHIIYAQTGTVLIDEN